jgi:hypothetical protein
MSSGSQPKRNPRVNVAALIVLVAAGAVSALAAWSALGLWRGLPYSQITALPGEEVVAAFRAASASAPEQVRAAWLLADVGKQFTAALRDEAALERLGGEVASYAAGQTHTQLGRLQQAATRMLELERAATPIEQWWPALEPYLVGLSRANFAHFEHELIVAWTDVYRSLGVAPGTACRNARLQVGHPHGPFLQYFVMRLRRVAQVEEQRGNAAGAQTCRTVMRCLLRQWVLDPGPPGVRLLAADLLADLLEAEPASTAASSASRLAQDLRAWRALYHDSACERPVEFLRLTSEPSLCPREYERLFTWLALSTWTCAAAIGLGLVVLLTGWAGLIRRRGKAHPLRAFIMATIVTAVIVATGVLWLRFAPDTIREDFRRDWSVTSLAEWWRYPLVSAALAIVLVSVPALVRRAPGGGKPARLVRLSAGASATWLVLATLGLVCILAADAAQTAYERATHAAALDPLRAIVGPDADRLLDGLRSWDSAVD